MIEKYCPSGEKSIMLFVCTFYNGKSLPLLSNGKWLYETNEPENTSAIPTAH